jgi:sugar/nucleoside kinase (ribokinase family)
MGAAEIVVVGGAVLDVLIKADMAPAATMAGTSTPSTVLSTSVGGVGWNVVRNLLTGRTRDSATGVNLRVKFHTVVGDDANGVTVAETLDAFQSSHVGALHTTVAVVTGESTAQYLALLGADGELAAAAAVMQIFDRHLTSEFVRQACVGAAVVVLDGNVSADGLDMALQGCNRLLVLDPISTSKITRWAPSLRRGATATAAPNNASIVVIKPNHIELEALARALGINTDRHVDLADLVRQVLLATTVDAIFCTAGARGVVIGCNQRIPVINAVGWTLLNGIATRHVAARPVTRVVKVTGAGDAFLASALSVLVGREGVHTTDTFLCAAESGVAAASRILQQSAAKL